MDDTEYKQRFHALTVQLGRVPDTRDREWWGLTEEMRRSWTGEGGALGRSGTAAINPGAATEPEAGSGAGGIIDGELGRALAGISSDSCAECSRALGRFWTERLRDGRMVKVHQSCGAGADCQTPPEPDWSLGLAPVVGARGPSGGILARCVVCSRVWERPARRGRPAYKCEECR